MPRATPIVRGRRRASIALRSPDGRWQRLYLPRSPTTCRSPGSSSSVEITRKNTTLACSHPRPRRRRPVHFSARFPVRNARIVSNVNRPRATEISTVNLVGKIDRCVPVGCSLLFKVGGWEQWRAVAERAKTLHETLENCHETHVARFLQRFFFRKARILCASGNKRVFCGVYCSWYAYGN